MTCVVGVIARGHVYMGGDSAVSNDDGDLEICREPKVWRAGRLAIGHAGSDAYSSALRWRLEWPTVPRATADLDRWANVDLVRQIKTLADEADCDGEAVMVGVRGRIYVVTIFETLSVARPRPDYAAIGSGFPHAISVLDAYAETLLAPKTKIRRALECAERRRTDVKRPWVWVQV
jgi:ATP-dependent protease HslVU (ClpYQ) peptidase subunit